MPLVIEIGSALAYLHDEGFVHTDVKPQNLIMGAPLRLIEISIARPFAELSSMRGPIGTDAYMAPERCLEDGLGRAGPATDVWGLGATLYEAAIRRVGGRSRTGWVWRSCPSARVARQVAVGHQAVSDGLAPHAPREPEGRDASCQ